MNHVEIYEQNLLDTEGKVKGKMAILRGGLAEDDPVEFMNHQVMKYVENEMHSHYVEVSMDNPYVRVVISDSNRLPFTEFKNQRLGRD